MSTTRYYRARCGSLYRVVSTPAQPATKTTRAVAASIVQARRSIYATTFSPAYPTTADEVARLVSIGSFVQVPAT